MMNNRISKMCPQGEAETQTLLEIYKRGNRGYHRSRYTLLTQTYVAVRA